MFECAWSWLFPKVYIFVFTNRSLAVHNCEPTDAPGCIHLRTPWNAMTKNAELKLSTSSYPGGNSALCRSCTQGWRTICTSQEIRTAGVHNWQVVHDPRCAVKCATTASAQGPGAIHRAEERTLMDRNTQITLSIYNTSILPSNLQIIFTAHSTSLRFETTL